MFENIHLFTGEENYLLNAKLSKWKTAFGEKYGKENLFVFGSNDNNVSGLYNAIYGGGLFQTKKFIVIHGLPKDTVNYNNLKEGVYSDIEKKIVFNLDSIPKDVILVFVSYVPDKRTKAYKTVTASTVITEFKKLSGKKLTEFVGNILQDLSSDELNNYLITLIGSSLYSLENESNKLKLYCMENKITKLNKDIVDKIIYSNNMVNSFDVLDNMFTNKEKAIQLIDTIQNNNNDHFLFLGMLYWGMKVLLQIIDLYESGITDVKAISGAMKVAPFVVLKNIKSIDKYIEQKDLIKDKFYKLLELDYGIKSGNLPSEIFWLQIKTII